MAATWLNLTVSLKAHPGNEKTYFLQSLHATYSERGLTFVRGWSTGICSGSACSVTAYTKYQTSEALRSGVECCRSTKVRNRRRGAGCMGSGAPWVCVGGPVTVAGGAPSPMTGKSAACTTSRWALFRFCLRVVDGAAAAVVRGPRPC